MAVKYIVPALAAISGAYAASCSSESTSTIVNPAGISALAACSTYSGNIVIETGAADAQGKVDLGSIEKIDGDLSYKNDNSVNSITAGSLEEIGNMEIANLSQIATISMSSLKSVNDLTLSGLSLASLGFGTPGIQKIGKLTVDNTGLQSLDGLNKASSIKSITITNNNALTQVAFPVQSLDSISVVGNNADSSQLAVSFSNLTTSKSDLTFRNISSIDLSSLQNSAGRLGFYGNSFQSLNLTNVTWLGGLIVDYNNNMNGLSFPKLTTINTSSIEVANNTKLLDIDGFSALEQVSLGAARFQGQFDELDLPKIKNIKGALVVQTTSTKFSCDGVNKFKTSHVVQGKQNCTVPAKNTDGSSNGGTSTTSGDGSSESSNAASPFNAPNFVMGTGFIGVLLSALL